MVTRKTIDAIKKVVDPVKRTIISAIARAVIRSIDDSQKMQSAKVGILANVTKDNLEHFQSYGFTSVPLKGAEGVAVFPQGNQDHGILVCVDDRRYRMKGLSDGEVAVYTDEGDYVHFKRGRIISINTSKLEVTATEHVTFNTNTFSVTAPGGSSFSHDISAGVSGDGAGNITTNGYIVADGDITSTSVGTSHSELKEAHNDHKHHENGLGGGITDIPDIQI